MEDRRLTENTCHHQTDVWENVSKIDSKLVSDINARLAHDPMFFSKEATIQISSRVGKALASYDSIPISESNNADMLYHYNLQFSCRTSGGPRSETFERIAVTGGQYM